MQIIRRKKNTHILVLFLLVVLIGSSCGWIFDEQKTMHDALSHQDSSEHNAAIIELKKVLKHNASNKQARLMLAKSYLDTGQGASAEKELNYAKKLGVTITDMADLWAQSLLMQKKYKKIFQDVPLALVSLPEKKAKLMLMHGYAHAALDDKLTAHKLFQNVKNGDYLHADANMALSRLAMSKKNTEKALKLINEVIASESNNISAWLQKGQILLAKQDLDNASKAFKKVLEHSNKSGVIMAEFQARVHLTQITLTQKKLGLARINAEKLIKVAPNNPLSMYFLALVDYQEKKYDQAMVLLGKVVAKVPNDLQSRFLLGAIHYAKGSYEQANKHLSYFVENVPTHLHARKLLGAVRIKLGQHQDALDALMPIGETSSDSELLSMIGRAAILNNDPKQAEKFYKRARVSNPTSQLLKRELANLYLTRGSIAEAINELESASGKDSQQTKQMLVYAYLRKNNLTSARRLATEMLTGEEVKPKNYSLVGIVELASGERMKAKDYFEKSLKLDSNYMPGMLSLARMEFEDGNLASAKKMFTEALSVDDKNINAMMGLSALASRENDSDDALKWLLQAKEKNPHALAPRMVLSQFYLKSGQPARVIELLSEFVSSGKDNMTVMPLLISAQLNSGQKNESLMSARAFLKTNSKAAIAYFHLARVQNALGNIHEIESALDTALRIKPDFLQANIAMATLKAKQGNYDSALEIAKQLKNKYPKQAVGLMLEGEIYLQQKQFNKAIKAFSVAYKGHQNSGIVRKLFLAYSRAGKNGDATRVLEQWLVAHPKDIPARFDLALHYERTKQKNNAQQQYHAVLELSPNHIAALNNISLSYIDIDISKALQFAERAYKLKPDIVYIADTLAWVLLTKGDIQRSVPILESAVKKSKNPSIHYHYAVGLNKSGSKEQAILVLEQILAATVDFPEKTQAKQLLKSLYH